MKRGIFYSNFARCCRFVVPMLFMLLGMNAAFANVDSLRMVSKVDATCGSSNGSITLAFGATSIDPGENAYSLAATGPGQNAGTALATGNLPVANTGLTVSSLAPGTYTFTLITYNAGNGNLKDSRAITVNVGGVYTPVLNGGMSCVGGSATSPGLYVTLNANCSTQLTASQLITNASGSCQVNNADFGVVVTSLGGRLISSNGTVTASEINQVVRVEVTHTASGIKCWGFVKIEDKTKPVVTAPASVAIRCYMDPAKLYLTGAVLTRTSPSTPNESTVVQSLTASVLSNITDQTTGYVISYPAGSAAQLLGLSRPVHGYVTDCSKTQAYFTDFVFYDNGCQAYVDGGRLGAAYPSLAGVAIPDSTYKIIIRTWTAKDQYGNISDPAYQAIFITNTERVLHRDPNIATFFGLGIELTRRVAVDSIVLPCTSPLVSNLAPTNLPNKYQYPYLDFDGVGGRTIFTSSYTDYNEPQLKPNEPLTCSVKVLDFTDGERISICGSTYKFVRTWRVLDSCLLAAGRPYPYCIVNYFQTFTIEDKVPPVVRASWTNWGQKNDQYCFFINGMRMTDGKSIERTEVMNQLFSNTAQTITPLANPNACGRANVLLFLNATDPSCQSTPLRITSPDSRIRFTAMANGMVRVEGEFMAGQPTSFTIDVVDACGNKSSQVYNVNLLDNATPNVVCKEFTRATLTQDGTVRLFADAFNNGSTDNCGIIRYLVRRMTVASNDACGVVNQVANPDACFYEFVDFKCGDVNDGAIMVQLLAQDEAGNWSTCMVNVTVDDKTPVMCTPGTNTSTIPCTDPLLASNTGINTLFTTPIAYDNCGFTIDSTTEVVRNECGTGYVQRNWAFTDCGGNVARCNQRYNITKVDGFSIKTLRDSVFTCSYEPNLEANKQQILANAINAGCGKLLIEAEQSEFTGTSFCRKYVQRFTIIDCCVEGAALDACVPANYGTVERTLNGTRKICFERVITVNDTKAPTFTQIADRNECDYTTNCKFGFSQDITASDECNDGSSATAALFYRWTIKNATTLQTVRQYALAINEIGTTYSALGTRNKTISARDLEFGSYIVEFTVTDACGNVSRIGTFRVTGKDCKKPAIVCHDVSAELMYMGPTVTGANRGSVRVWAEDLLASPLMDNCTPTADLNAKLRAVRDDENRNPSETYPVSRFKFDASTGKYYVEFNCNDLTSTANPVPVQLWTVDNAGNADFCLAYVTVQDNLNRACGSNVTPATVTGTIKASNNEPTPGTTVAASANGVTLGSATASATGSFSITPLTRGANVQVRATNTGDQTRYNGVTTFDIATISKHILGSGTLNTPYKVIAADVDRSNEVDAADMLHLRRFILHITPALPGGTWRFVDKAYTFRNPANPLGEDFPEVVNLANLPVAAQADFTAVKLGDVNESYVANFSGVVVRSGKTLTLNTEDIDVIAGNEYTVSFSADNFNAKAFQGTFNFDGAAVKTVKAGELNNMSDANFGLFANQVTTSWDGEAKANADNMFSITFLANKSAKLSEVLTIGSELTPAVAYDAQGSAMNVNLKFNSGKVSGGEFALYQNKPNPVSYETRIGFNLPKEGNAKLTVYNVEGKVLKVVNGEYKAGYNEININKAELGASGVLYYRLDTNDQSATRKMIIIE